MERHMNENRKESEKDFKLFKSILKSTAKNNILQNGEQMIAGR